MKVEQLTVVQKLYVFLIYSLPFYSISFYGFSIKDLLVLILLGYLTLKLLKSDLKISKNESTILILILMFFLFSIISIINSPNIISSLRASISIINIFLVTIITFEIIRTRLYFNLIIKSIYVISVLISVVGVLQILSYELFGFNIGGVPGYPFLLSTNIRATGFFHNPNLYGFFLHLAHSLSLVSILMYRVTRILPYKFKYLILNHAIILMAIVASGSKGAFLSLVAGTLIIIFIVLIRKRTFPIVLMILLIPIFWLLNNLNYVFSLILQDNGEVNSRIDFWKFAINMFQQKPLFGFGMNSFREVNNIDLIPHSLYLQTLSENGLVGLLILILIIIVSIYYLIDIMMKTENNNNFYISLALFAGLIEMLVHSISLSSLNNVMLWICISLISVHYYLFKYERKKI